MGRESPKNWQVRRSELGKFLGALLGARDAQRLLLVVVEVGRVARTAALGQERRFDLKMTVNIYGKCKDGDGGTQRVEQFNGTLIAIIFYAFTTL